ncbi:MULTISPECIES: response regulator transcription factor [unclassified Sphingomonas]|uniref:response regulator transcription factor n=1 Tax=unclassified Sphingomonas TaxID=196159 RepID=UPI0006F32FC5|nr:MULTISPECIES: response regulator transcription factor [unclassified Sphingomonas]KQM61855.1 LuxR family transcriptional regulator [Sphingomonas sp. Leaf16]KQN13128.1 LuxR family transcriptional regulator [Sphingomonas sp. Leaf29]KQN20014.1 LuxR family transcriptional regulator [Sphingomonas sp. Leaf32]
MTTILVADDHPLFRQALTLAVLQVRPDARIVEAGSLDRAVQAVRDAGDLALILLDLNMPGAVGYSGVALLHAEVPEVPILVVSGADRAAAFAQVARFGAVGFVGKDAALDSIEAAIAAALAGDRKSPDAAPADDMAARVAALTPTQLRVLLGVLAGRLNKQIAHDLGIAEATVKVHMTAVLRKLDVGNRTQAAVAARALGLEVMG